MLDSRGWRVSRAWAVAVVALTAAACGGDKGPTQPSAPVGPLTFATVSAGYWHTCGVITNGAVYCWGYNDDGELGDGTPTWRTSPVAVAGGLAFATVSARYFDTCGVTTSGAAYCWGDNYHGQLGDGTTLTDRWSPVAVGRGLTFVTASAGRDHSCGVTVSGAAYCWGSNTHGELGDGTTTPRTSPAAVAGGLTFATVSAGLRHSCGVTTSGAARFTTCSK